MSISRALRNAALAAALVVPGTVMAGAPAAHAAPAGCHWADMGGSGTVYVVDGRGSKLTAGHVYQQFDYCGNTRARFVWDNWFRTTGHPGITGAWVRVYDNSYSDGRYRDSGEYGSTSGPEVTTNPISVHSWGDNAWTGEADVRVTHNGGTSKCIALSSTWDYHVGNAIEAPTTGTCG
ncbi:hypothetical protein AB0A70_07125 [Streptomyces morookaense]|uniref:hypothetical protein n=1 Tax=Streptomyces morookaense TaxID=1970 RepID=UPI0033D6E62A